MKIKLFSSAEVEAERDAHKDKPALRIRQSRIAKSAALRPASLIIVNVDAAALREGLNDALCAE